jgi:hypothetical protein
MRTKIQPVLTGRECACAADYVEGEWMLPPKYESTTQKGLYFWAEEFDGAEGGRGPRCWIVTQQAEGYPATEAFDDWLANFADADEIAQKLARGEDTGGHF